MNGTFNISEIKLEDLPSITDNINDLHELTRLATEITRRVYPNLIQDTPEFLNKSFCALSHMMGRRDIST